MSYEILYQYNVRRIPGSELKDGIQRFVLSAEMGSSNCYVGNKRARSWDVMAVGTADEVLRQVVRLASSCEGGTLKPAGRDCTPEAFIGKMRRLLKAAEKEGTNEGWWTASVRTGERSVAERAKALGGMVSEETHFGETRMNATFEGELDGYFTFVSEHHREMYGWQLARVYGLQAS